MGISKNIFPGPFRVLCAQQEIRRTKGKEDNVIQAAVDAAVREGSPMEVTARTLKQMNLSEAKIAQFMQAAYPYPG
jgi:hypothetical protein